ncbi:hypothetical protein BJP40_00670 [Streptomyces sp. CC53]|uniref:SAP domain-containing protein n=1 Tax=Streptomyces sp. CC53 TaxID=1906740 RepID=UPI0008DD46CB|nr:SAP domain-containing protein [Streptomyces sp. CC53]OII60108.1 hypothetical protein BJP40_00670 [Streptomyces sp. CC53]
MRVQFTRRVANPRFSARPGQIVDLPEAEALTRIAAGHCTAVDTPTQRRPAAPARQRQAPQDSPLEKLTVPQLQEYADERDISLPDGGRKADLVQAIQDAEAARVASE